MQDKLNAIPSLSFNNSGFPIKIDTMSFFNMLSNKLPDNNPGKELFKQLTIGLLSLKVDSFIYKLCRNYRICITVKRSFTSIPQQGSDYKLTGELKGPSVQELVKNYQKEHIYKDQEPPISTKSVERSSVQKLVKKYQKKHIDKDQEPLINTKSVKTLTVKELVTKPEKKEEELVTKPEKKEEELVKSSEQELLEWLKKRRKNRM